METAEAKEERRKATQTHTLTYTLTPGDLSIDSVQRELITQLAAQWK